MFDVGFWELCLIGVIALLILGPERLPRVARTAGFWVGRARRFMADVKADIDSEINRDELNALRDIGKDLRHAGEDIASAGRDLDQTITPEDEAIIDAVNQPPGVTTNPDVTTSKEKPATGTGGS